VPIPAAVSASLSPKDTRFSEQTRASNQTQTGGELTRVETQSGLMQLQYVIGPLGRLPFRLRRAPQVTNPRRHLMTVQPWRSTELRRASTVPLRRTHRRSSAQCPYANSAPPPLRLPPADSPRGGKQNARSEGSITRSRLERTSRPLPGVWAAQLRRIPPSSRHRDRTVPASGPPRARPMKRGAEVTCPASPLPPGVRDQRGRDARRRASRGPLGPAAAR